ncbi:precorrin-6Y C5,15-methyltransferase (decarboxylating) subunit CbiT [Clostridium sp. WLY-B-L2]|uniref:Precorrin-6Y C5,15-methyltransferase (Decarboxylating) subunit CbiT n=1 Tax=Clostridium aromativorans TaxID=2836848 RepID=A0ABS8N5K1_9CLOT|nr:precorrin-6Y C5,15-methyltransferase (decarboxylating) subunit CbiT [Clostridium aromativorans]MCC9295077.1 precorrin-6Y C5,15-methyltransferase (decarboxylating) subunit CbiT [Clostridium aromativorans]
MIHIKDNEFIRGNCPMTKEEIRILSISKLGIKEDSRVLDIGAGTGSVSIQLAKICSKGEIFAVEKNEEAIHLIEQNRKKFDVHNLTIIKGEALEVEEDISPGFDAVFIGGSGGNIEDIIKKYSLKLKTQANMVLNFITLDNLYRALNTLKDMKYQVECIQVSINKTRGKSYMMTSNNSIFIVTAIKP